MKILGNIKSDLQKLYRKRKLPDFGRPLVFEYVFPPLSELSEKVSKIISKHTQITPHTATSWLETPQRLPQTDPSWYWHQDDFSEPTTHFVIASYPYPTEIIEFQDSSYEIKARKITEANDLRKKYIVLQNYIDTLLARGICKVVTPELGDIVQVKLNTVHRSNYKAVGRRRILIRRGVTEK